MYRYTLQDIVRPLQEIFPEYDRDVSLISVALETRTANCAVQAYASGLLIRQAYPDITQVVVSFGFSKRHGMSEQGTPDLAAEPRHALTKVSNTSARRAAYPFIVESFKDSRIVVKQRSHEPELNQYAGLAAGYQEYLDRLGYDVSVNPDRDLEQINAAIENWHSTLASAS